VELELPNLAGEREGQERQVPSALDSGRELTLMLRAGPRLAAWPDFAVFGYEAAQEIGLFVINSRVFIRAELADFRPGDITPERWLLVLINDFVTHSSYSN
jgi:hypothetical protein